MTEIQILNKPTIFEKPGVITLKLVILWVCGIIAAFAFGWFLKDYLGSTGLNSFAFTAFAALIFLIFYLLQTFFTLGSGASAFIIFLESIAVILPFMAKSLIILSAIPVIFLILFIGNSNGRNALNNGLKINFWSVSKAVLPKGIVAISLLIGGLMPVYLSASGKEQLPLSPFLFNEIVSPGSFVLGRFFPGANFSFTLEDLASKTAAEKLNQITNARSLSDSQKKQFLDDFMSESYRQISLYAGTSVNPKLAISDSLYQIAKEKFLGLSDYGKNVIYAIIGILIFFSIEAVSWPLRMVVSIAVFIIFEILLALDFAQISNEQTNREVIIT